jgi:glycosyltransferase involved in cell wall biosynthesis
VTKRVAFVTTHPIQYQVPIFRILERSPEIDFTVLFCQIPTREMQGDGFGVAFEWDVPLLDGYRYELLKNVAESPSVGHFRGCDTPEIGGRIRDGGYDAVIVNGWVVKSCLQTLRACRRLNVPCLVRGEANVMRPRAWWKRLLHGRLLRQYSAYLYIGSSNRTFYERHGARPEQLFPARYCIENDRFAAGATAEARRSMRQELGLAENDVCFLFSGKFIEKKHPVELVRAFREAAKRGSEAHLIMVGDGPLRAECEAIAAADNLRVKFAGFVNQGRIPGMYAASDCLVLPSDHGETWGLVVNEAMACGLPAIVSDQVGCGPDLIEPGRTGHIFRLGDWNGLADLMTKAAATPETLKFMGEESRKLIQEYSPEAAADGIVRAVEWATGPAANLVISGPNRI